jgi:hypothetical protein
MPNNLFTKANLNYFKWIGFFLLFLLLAFDPDMSRIYLLILLIDFIWYVSDDFVSFQYSSGKNTWIKSLATAIVGFAAFLLVTTGVLSIIPGAQSVARSGMQSIFQLLATATPILKESKILTVIGWGLVIPIIETSFFNGRLLEGIPAWLKEKAGFKNATILTDERTPFNKKIFNGVTVFVILLVAASFTLFHLSAKGLASIPLLITFIFSVISSILVIKDGDLKSAIMLHVITNTVTVLNAYGLIPALGI